MTIPAKPLAAVALTGNTGVGKDELGRMLVQRGYARLAFGDCLRADVIGTYGKPAVTDERSTNCYPTGLPGIAQPCSFKDAMLLHGGSVALTDPLRYSRMLADKLQCSIEQHMETWHSAKLAGQATTLQPVVITDLRKPVELLTLRRVRGIALYVVEVRSKVRGECRRLDGLLGSGLLAAEKYAAVHVQPPLAELHGVISNDREPSDMLRQLSSILELAVPYEYL